VILNNEEEAYLKEEQAGTKREGEKDTRSKDPVPISSSKSQPKVNNQRPNSSICSY
jgi:hypothetical protein